MIQYNIGDDAIAVVTVFGDNIRALFGASANALAGTSTPETETREFEGEIHKDLKDFAKDIDEEP